MTSMRKLRVVMKAARLPIPKVTKDGRRFVPVAPRLSMNKETIRARKERTHAIG